MSQRITISFFMTAILLFALCFSQAPLFRPFFVLLTATVIGLAHWEYSRIAFKAVSSNIDQNSAKKFSPSCNQRFAPLLIMSLTASAAFVLSNYITIIYPGADILPQIILWLALIAFFLYYFSTGTAPFLNIALSAFGILYITLPLSLILNITYFYPEGHAQNGAWWISYVILVTKITDIGAYFIGKKFGATKMTPYISPKKTWEGAAGGLATALLTSLLFIFAIRKSFETPPLPLSYFQGLWTACAISLLAQFGDLAESLLKRDAGIKDSSQLPGLGGMLDIVDSLIFTCPFIYFLLKYGVLI